MDNLADVRCFACGKPGHLKAQCPALRSHLSLPVPAATAISAKNRDQAAHLARIQGIVELWIDGTITMQQKREAIAAENMDHYGGPMTRSGISLTRP